MSRSKKTFLIVFVIFILTLIVVTWDMGRKTTFPGSKKQLQERIKKQFLSDSIKNDSLKK